MALFDAEWRWEKRRVWIINSRRHKKLAAATKRHYYFGCRDRWCLFKWFSFKAQPKKLCRWLLKRKIFYWHTMHVIWIFTFLQRNILDWKLLCLKVPGSCHCLLLMQLPNLAPKLRFLLLFASSLKYKVTVLLFKSWSCSSEIGS